MHYTMKDAIYNLGVMLENIGSFERDFLNHKEIYGVVGDRLNDIAGIIQSAIHDLTSPEKSE